VDEASQFYPLFGLGANVALIFSGRAVKIFSQIRAELPPDVDGWGLSLRGLMGMVVIGGLLISGANSRLKKGCFFSIKAACVGQ
jgi:AAA family ATP:ADP antiporter